MGNVTKLDSFKRVEHALQIKKKITEKYNKDSDEGYFEVDAHYPEELYDLCKDLSILLEGVKIERIRKLVVNLIKKNISNT